MLRFQFQSTAANQPYKPCSPQPTINPGNAGQTTALNPPNLTKNSPPDANLLAKTATTMCKMMGSPMTRDALALIAAVMLIVGIFLCASGAGGPLGALLIGLSLGLFLGTPILTGLASTYNRAAA